ncbi:hypothetical protein [Chitinophaga sp. Ak27]|uniref:hypothetical protein n=1 Tax=Chitinophaga sp. Ak27 TaxID=2726116 RepID=UPI00145EC630|nr:hypothetical protein [Chitinophaga sp. Ak27]NLU91230.1 hypothetical protein [Chitinophaga sp. Ak27]
MKRVFATLFALFLVAQSYAQVDTLNVKKFFKLGVDGSFGGQAYSIGFTRSIVQVYGLTNYGLLLGGTVNKTDMNIAPNGNVGIGLDAGGTPPAPAARLHIISDNQQFLFGTGTCTSGYSLGVGVNDDGVNFNLNTGLRGFNFVNANLSANPNGRLLTISATGNVAIGNNNPQRYKLAVEGTIGARRVKVTQESWADFVFNKDYQLPAVHEVADFIKQNKHLPGIPTTQQVKEEGIDLGEMNKLLLQKVEEQMLYIIQLNKQVQELSQKIKNQERN